MRWTITLLLCCGCTTPPASTGTWMEGFQVRWELFNHRVSYLHLDVADGEPEAAFIGGTSTTGVNEALDDGCDEDSCSEFPFYDESDVRIAWATTTTTAWLFASGEVTLVATAEGVSGEVEVEVEGATSEQAYAVLQGFTLDTDYELSGGDACYQPHKGWHPRRIHVSVDDVTVTEGVATVSLSAHFAAGDSMEEVRACVDAVNEQAQVPIRVAVLVAVGDGEVQEDSWSYEMSYEYSGDESDPGQQPDPDLAERSWSAPFDNTLVGFSEMDFAFHEVEGIGRGAYLRTLWVEADPVAGFVTGHANNYSPATQLSGFDYRFDGTTIALDAGAEVTRSTAQDIIAAELDDDGSAVIFSL